MKLEEINLNTIEEKRDKIENDMCSVALDLEYFKGKQKKNKIVTLENGAKLDYDKLVQGLENAILILQDKLNILNKVITKKYDN